LKTIENFEKFPKFRYFFCIFLKKTYTLAVRHFFEDSIMKRLLLFICITGIGLGTTTILSSSVLGGVFDCFWGGSNEETDYTAPYLRGMGGVTLSQLPTPPLNLGAPPTGQQTALPVQATPNTQTTLVPQATIPTITVPAGPVGTVGRPATQPENLNPQQLPPGTEIIYVIPGKQADEECIAGFQGTPLNAAKVVPAGTPGAIPVTIRTTNVIKQKIEYRWTYSPIRTKTETLVKVVNPRTGKVVRSFCQTDEEKSALPWLHREEVVSYETVPAKIGTPVSLTPSAATTTNTVIRSISPTVNVPTAPKNQ
jgi:hypothetical protein